MADCHSTLSDDPRVDPRPELPTDDPAGDSLVEVFEGADGYVLLSEAIEPVDEPDRCNSQAIDS